MSKHIKIIVSLILLLCYLASPVSVMAAIVETAMLDNGTKVVEVSNIKTTSFETEGTLEVVVGFDLPIAVKTEKVISFTLSDENNASVKTDINLKGENVSKELKLGTQAITIVAEKSNQSRDKVQDEKEFYYLNIITTGLKQGRYNVKLEGEGFVPYEYKDIEVSDYSKRLSLTDKKGTFAIGDINGDKKINQADYDLLTDKIEAQETTDLTKYDLNLDGEIDIVDLSYIASNMEENTDAENIEGVLENTNPIISSNNVNLSTDENTRVISVENLFDKAENTTVGLQATGTITEDNPATLNMDFDKSVETSKISVELGSQNVPNKMEIVVTTEDGTIIRKNYDENNKGINFLSDQNEVVVVDLEGQVAVKRVTIRVTGVRNDSTLAEISSVEFLNNIYEEIPPPKMDIPENLTLTAGSEQLTASWTHAVNVTGYKVKINGGKVNNKTYETTKNTLIISGLDNYTEYSVQVESVNGNWESGYSETVTGTPIPNRVPPVPEQINVKGDYQRISVTWKKMDDTQSYNIYYRKAGEDYTKISGITSTSYIIYGLEDQKEYEIQISGTNHLGEGSKSSTYKATTTTLTAAVTRNYKLINIPKEENGVKLENELTEHIKDVTYPSASSTENFDKWDIVDNDYTSYWKLNSWDAGGFNAGKPSPIVEFDDTYKMDNLIVVPADTQPHDYFYVKLRYWNDQVSNAEVSGVSMVKKTDSNGKVYYDFKFAEPIEANKIQVNFALYSSGSSGITIAEMKFYYYDDIEAEVAKLFKDDLRVELQDGVTEEMIKALEDRANTPDTYSGELHPNVNVILADLEYARTILNDTAISDTIIVDQTVNTGNSSHCGFSYALNDMQPLGYTVKAEDQIAVYLGISGSANVQVVFTQYYPEYSNWKSTTVNLKKGQNILTVPKLTTRDVEKGGQIYVRYNSTQATNTQIKVRVSGGEKIPLLDIHGLTDETEIKDRIRTYTQELTEHVANLQKFYEDKPYGYAYDSSTSILNATDIVMDDVMLSIPATQALSGIGASASTTDQVNRLYNSNLAWKEMIALFYKEKGLSKTAENAKDQWPGARLNIRYTRMFDGAFMYASSGHIGIGFGSCSGVVGGNPSSVVDGVTTTSGYFGWGISHEIGHVIDQTGYVKAEITNNIYSLLAQTADDMSLSRLEMSNKYNGIYQKVTSHTEGLPSDVFVALGMYWQLHLAYDNGPILTETDTFYSRLNTLYRNNGGSGTDTLICYASKAAGKDLTEYFKAWGLYVTDEETVKAYMQENSLTPETRPIYYINDDARRYRLNGGTGVTGTKTVTATQSLDNQNKTVKLTFSIDAAASDILGYEILRNGVSVGFTTTGEFTDELNALNNRALSYEVIAYDKLLNKVGTKTLEEIKIAYDGTINKAKFTVDSNMMNSEDGNEYEAEEVISRSVENIIDGDLNTVFNGNTRKIYNNGTTTPSATNTATPYIIIDLNENLPICGVRYTAGVENGTRIANTINGYKIYVSSDNETWKQVRSGTFKFDSNNQATVYFTDDGSDTENQLYTTTASYVKIEATGNTGISGAEIDVITPPGDNIEATSNDIFKLSENYVYGTGTNDVIPAGSVVIKAEYRGNPAYNVAAIADKDGKLINVGLEGESETANDVYNEIFTATIPEYPLTEVSKGYCLIYMTEDVYNKIKASYADGIRLNLYRVNNAETNEGERLVSDTLLIHFPETLQSGVIESSAAETQSISNDVEAETEIDANTDTQLDTNVNTNTNVEKDTDVNTNTNVEEDVNTNTNTNANTNTNTNTNANTDVNASTNTEEDTNVNTNTDSETNNIDTKTDTNTTVDTNSDTENIGSSL